MNVRRGDEGLVVEALDVPPTREAQEWDRYRTTAQSWDQALGNGQLTEEGRALVLNWEHTAPQFRSRLLGASAGERQLALRLMERLLADDYEVGF